MTLLEVARKHARHTYDPGVHRDGRHYWTSNLGAGGLVDFWVDEPNQVANITHLPYDTDDEEEDFRFEGDDQADAFDRELTRIFDLTDSID